jgi:hypothetical protein
MSGNSTSHAPRPKATSIDVPTSAQAELDRIIDELAHLGFALPGTITRRMTRCGRPSCRCQADQDPRLHGPYIQWTRAVKAKTITKTLSPAQHQTYQPWIDNNRRLRQLTSDLHTLTLNTIRTIEGWGAQS